MRNYLHIIDMAKNKTFLQMLSFAFSAFNKDPAPAGAPAGILLKVGGYILLHSSIEWKKKGK